jgi:RNA polymerase sigma-70 factor (ECF subfamily)
MSCVVLGVEAAGPWVVREAGVSRRRSRRDPVREMVVDTDETEILRRCQAGEELAFQQIVENYSDRAYWVAYHIVGDAEEARDVSQEAFLKMFRSIDRFRLDRNFYTWFYKIVVNVSIDSFRKKRTSRSRSILSLEAVGEVAASRNGPEPRLENEDLGRGIQRVIDSLPPTYRKVLMLCNVDGLNCREISDLLGVNHATVRWQLHKARQLFIERWEDGSPIDSPVRSKKEVR